MFSFPFFIALRYLFAKKGNNLINWISGISVAVVAVVSSAIIVILSAMNGLSDTVKNLYGNFDPDIKITATKGKFTDVGLFKLAELKQIEGVAGLSVSLEETVLIKYKDNQEVATVKGVEDNFVHLTGLDEFIVEGFYALNGGGRQFAVIGNELAYKLGVNTALPQSLGIFIPNLESNFLTDDEFFRSIHPKPVGIFDINVDFNAKYVLVNIDFVKELLNLTSEISAVEIKLNDPKLEDKVITTIQSILGDDFTVKTRFELNAFLFKSINMEKWITLMILSLIVVLAIFNVIGSLTMLIIDKSKDIFILQSMGAKMSNIQWVFWLEGTFIAVLGALIGLSIGGLICFVQLKTCYLAYGVGKIDCFPVSMEWGDFVWSFIIVVGISAFFTLIPVLRIKNK